MKKLIALMLVAVVLLFAVAPAAMAADTGAAAALSIVMPGAGEWYNSGFRTGFPWAECIVGYICFLFRFSSVVDAAAGVSDSSMRLDFWSAPN